MTIVRETEFNIGDEVFYLTDGKVAKKKVTQIAIFVNEDNAITRYFIDGGFLADEKEIFRTQAELIDAISYKGE